MKPFQVEILTADHVFYEGACESLIVPTPDGQYGILAGHFPVVSAITPGEMSYRVPGGAMQQVAVSHGMFKVENNRVLILVDSAERPEEIDVNRARLAAEHAKEAMLQKRSVAEYRLAQANLARAASRLRVKAHYEKLE